MRREMDELRADRDRWCDMPSDLQRNISELTTTLYWIYPGSVVLPRIGCGLPDVVMARGGHEMPTGADSVLPNMGTG